MKKNKKTKRKRPHGTVSKVRDQNKRSKPHRQVNQSTDKRVVADLALERLSTALPEAELYYDEEEFTIKSRNTAHVLWLHSLYTCYYVADAAHQKQLMADYVSLAADPPTFPESLDDARSRLLPVVKKLLNSDILLESPSERINVNIPLTEQLCVGIVYDHPQCVMHVPKVQADEWGISERDLFDLARENLLRRLTDRLATCELLTLSEVAKQWDTTEAELQQYIADKFGTPTNGALDGAVQENGEYGALRLSIQDAGFVEAAECSGLFFARPDEDDWYASSRVLVPEWLACLPIEGDPVVLIPDQVSIFACGADNADALAKMAEIATADSTLRPITRIPIRLTPEGPEPFIPDASHPSHTAFKQSAVEETGAIYAKQQASLLSAEIGFVASYFAPKRADTRPAVSLTTWTRNANPLLPKTDYVVFCQVTLDEATGRPTSTSVCPVPVPWEIVEAVVGDRLSRTAHTPARYRASGFPSDEELDQLQSAAAEVVEQDLWMKAPEMEPA